MAQVALNYLGSAAGKSWVLRVLLCEWLWGRIFLMAPKIASDGGALADGEGLGKGAGLALLAVPIPMADGVANAFDFTQAQFQRNLFNFLGLEGAKSKQHTHHSGAGVTRVLRKRPTGEDHLGSINRHYWIRYTATPLCMGHSQYSEFQNLIILHDKTFC